MDILDVLLDKVKILDKTQTLSVKVVVKKKKSVRKIKKNYLKIPMNTHECKNIRKYMLDGFKVLHFF